MRKIDGGTAFLVLLVGLGLWTIYGPSYAGGVLVLFIGWLLVWNLEPVVDRFRRQHGGGVIVTWDWLRFGKQIRRVFTRTSSTDSPKGFAVDPLVISRGQPRNPRDLDDLEVKK